MQQYIFADICNIHRLTNIVVIFRGFYKADIKYASSKDNSHLEDDSSNNQDELNASDAKKADPSTYKGLIKMNKKTSPISMPINKMKKS